MRSLAIAGMVAVFLSGCVQDLATAVTDLADWPERTLEVGITRGLVEGELPQIAIRLRRQIEPDVCPTLGEDARWFAGAAGGALTERGRVDSRLSGGGSLIPPTGVSATCVPPTRELPISPALGDDDVIAVGFADNSATFSVNVRRPPVDPAFTTDVPDGSVMARGDEVRFQSNVPLQHPDTTVTADFSQCRGSELIDCSPDPLSRVEGNDVIVTIPDTASADTAAIFVTVTEAFSGTDCSGADTCEVTASFLWRSRIDLVIE